MCICDTIHSLHFQRPKVRKLSLQCGSRRKCTSLLIVKRLFLIDAPILVPSTKLLMLAYDSIKKPLGVLENTLIGIRKYIVPIDLYILETKNYADNRIILRNPFLTLVKTVLDIGEGKITTEIGGEKSEC